MSASPKKRTHARTNSTEVYDSARLELVVPHDSNLDFAAAIAAFDGGARRSGSSGIPTVSHIEQRTSLLYDEHLPVFVVLQLLAPLDESLYESYLARLAISLEVAAVDGQKRQSEYQGRSQEGIHLLFQTVIDEKQTPRITLEDNNAKRLAVWKLNVPLGHPRARLSNPRVVITASATIRPAELQKPVIEDEYIVSHQPFGINLLEAYSDDPSLASVNPRLSALRVSRVIPMTQAPQQAIRPLGYASKRSFNIFPAINIRLRYSRILSGSKQTIIACLDLEITPFSECSVSIEHVDISVSGGRAELIGDSPSTALPILSRPRDDMTFLYTLIQTDTIDASQPPNPNPKSNSIRPISVSLRAIAHISPSCRPQISTNWTTTVDFSTPQNSSSFTPSHGIQRAHRPPSLGSIIHGATVSSSAGIRPVYQPSNPSPNVTFTPPLNSQGFSTLDNTQGLTITFTGPSRVHVGKVFSWTVFIVNRSLRPRKLALIVPPKRRRGEGKVLPAPPSNGDITDAVMEEGVVYQTHRAQYLEPAELVPLVNDVRVGPLLPSACHTVDLRFIALAAGVLSIEGIRVVDLASNETTDCRELPSIVSVVATTPLPSNGEER